MFHTRETSRVQSKVLLGTFLLVAASVATLSICFLFGHQAALQDQMRLRADSIAGSLAAQSQSALRLNNRDELERLARSALAAAPDLVYVALDDAGGLGSASAARPDWQLKIPPPAPRRLARAPLRRTGVGADGASYIETSIPVVANAKGGPPGLQSSPEETLGRVRVALSLKAQDALFASTLRQVCGIALLILLAACAAAYAQIRRLLRPLDELIHSFHELAGHVAGRTRELSEQVAARELARAELAEAQRRLIELSRRSGLAETATSVLHNVANVLNSVNVSATLVSTAVRESRLGRLAVLSGLLNQHSADMNSFLRDSPKGQRVLPYLGNLYLHLQHERETVLRELERLSSHVAHIQQIVSTQQDYARVSGLTGQFRIQELVLDAIGLLKSSFQRHQIETRCDFDELPPIHSDKHQVLQILLNLLLNATQAIDEAGPRERLIRVRICRHEPGRIRLEVTGSGTGLSPENLTRVFPHGFATKADDHGFSLHSSALAARQLGGSLSAASEGPGLGATFTLELPLENLPAPQETEAYASSLAR